MFIVIQAKGREFRVNPDNVAYVEIVSDADSQAVIVHFTGTSHAVQFTGKDATAALRALAFDEPGVSR